MISKHEEIKNKIIQVRAEMMLTDPVVPVTLGGMPLKEPYAGMNFPVMATDGRSIFYNTSGLEGRLDGHIAYILVHEASHILHGHHIRIIEIWNKVKNGFFKDIVMTEEECHRLYNIACDYVINGDINRGVRPHSLIQVPEDVLLDPKYSDGSWDADSVFIDMVLTGHDPAGTGRGTGRGRR